MLMNQPRAQALMAKDDLAALVATAPENVTYTSGFWAMSQWIRRGPQAYAVHPAPGFGEPCIITTTGALDLVADQNPPVAAVQRYGFFVLEVDAAAGLDPVQERLRELLAQEDGGDPVAALVKALQARGLDGARVGIDEYGIPPAYLAKVREALPRTTFVPAWEVFRQIRAIKTPEEVARLRGSAQIAEKASNTPSPDVATDSKSASRPGLSRSRRRSRGTASGRSRLLYWKQIGTRSGSRPFARRFSSRLSNDRTLSWNAPGDESATNRTASAPRST